PLLEARRAVSHELHAMPRRAPRRARERRPRRGRRGVPQARLGRRERRRARVRGKDQGSRAAVPRRRGGAGARRQRRAVRGAYVAACDAANTGTQSYRMNRTNEKKRIAIIADDEDLGRVLLAESVAAVGLESLAFA